MHLTPHRSLLSLAALFLLAACSRAAKPSAFEASLPVSPGQPWDTARAALEHLDPAARELEGVGGRTTVARAPITVAGVTFQEVSIAGVASRSEVRTVKLSAQPPASGCDQVREGLLEALGSDWTAGETRLGAVTATNGPTRSARIVCNGGELSVSIIG